MFSTKNLSPSITDMIRFDHSHVVATFHQYVVTGKPAVRKALADTICDALDIHATLEEELFYPVLRQLGLGGTTLGKSVPEHIEMRRIIAEIRAADPVTYPRYDQYVHELMRDVLHHVADEETVLLPEAERMLSKSRLNELGAQMTRRRLQLLAPKAGRAAKNIIVGFSSSTAAVVVGLAGALLAARAVSRKSAPRLPAG